MTKGRRAWLIIAPALAFLLGCAAAPQEGRVCVGGPWRQNLKVAVAAFEDQRPVEEIGAPVPQLAAVAQDLAVGMPGILSQTLVDRFSRENFFRSATTVEASGSPPSPEFLARLADQGFDAVITGNLPSCMGTTCLTGGSREGSYMYRLVTMTFFRLLLVIPPLGKLHNEGEITVTDVRLTDTRSGSVLWQGSFNREAMSHTSKPAASAAVTKVMEEVAGDIVKDLRTRWASRPPLPPVLRPGPRERP